MNSHELIYSALELGLEDNESFEALERPVFFGELEPAKSTAVLTLNGVAYTITVEKA